MVQKIEAVRTGLAGSGVARKIDHAVVGTRKYVAHEAAPAVTSGVIKADAMGWYAATGRVEKPETFLTTLTVGGVDGTGLASRLTSLAGDCRGR